MLLEIKDLSYRYSVGTPFEHKALDDINLTIDENEFIGLIGQTGSGKSTLIKHFNGLIKPASGQVLIDGKNIFESKAFLRNARFTVGVVFQYPEYQLFEETVYKDIAFGPKNMKLDEKEIDRRVLESVALVGLNESVLDKSPFELSGGQKRRVAIAGVIAMQPRLLVLDEPTAGLDPRGKREVMDYIRQYALQEGHSVLFVSHSMTDVARYAQRVIVMNESKIVIDGTVAQVFAHAQELKSMGLSVPQITDVFIKLKEKGYNVRTDIFTVKQAATELAALRGGDADA